MSRLDMDLWLVPILLCSGFVAGLMNAVAGGGALVTLPILLACGLPPVVANASNIVAVWPGHPMALVSGRRSLAEIPPTVNLKVLFCLAVAGGALGAWALNAVGNDLFRVLIAPLVAIATLVFVLGPRIRSALWQVELGPVVVWPVIFVVSVYGGFFGGGLGVMLMAALLLLGVDGVHANNAVKNFLASAVTSAGAVLLVLAGLVSWQETAWLLLGSVSGGLLGGRVASRLPAGQLKGAIAVLGGVLTAYYAGKYNFS